MRKFMFAFLSIFVLVIGAAQAATVDVDIQGFAFSPGDLTITTGTTVRWTNLDGVAHTSTSDGAGWDSGSLANGQDYSFTFTTAGSYPYHCTFHPSMTATVTVNDPRPVPTLGIF